VSHEWYGPVWDGLDESSRAELHEIAETFGDEPSDALLQDLHRAGRDAGAPWAQHPDSVPDHLPPGFLDWLVNGGPESRGTAG
jgi:hypothetical protein